MTTYSGIWDRQLDAKGRLAVPVEHSATLGEFPILTLCEGCLLLLPEGVWERVVSRHGHDAVGFHERYRVWERSAHLWPIGLGNPCHRLTIPYELRDRAGLPCRSECQVIGAGPGLIVCRPDTDWQPALRELWRLYETAAGPTIGQLLGGSLLEAGCLP